MPNTAEQIQEQIQAPMEDQALNTLDRKAVVTELMGIRNQIAMIEAQQVKPLKKRRDELESYLKATLEVGEKVSYAGIGMVSMKEEIQPNVTDWDALYDYITENNAFYFLQRKVNGAPFRESLDAGMPPAGVEPVTVRKLSVRKA